MVNDGEDWPGLQTTKLKSLAKLFKPFNRDWAPLSTGATRLGVLHSQILAYLILLSLLWHVLKSFVRFFAYYDANLISDEDYVILYKLLSSRIQILLTKAIVSTWMELTTMNARPNLE